jgi:hypothetical protein
MTDEVFDKVFAFVLNNEVKQVLGTNNSFAELLLNSNVSIIDVTEINAESPVVIGSIYNQEDNSFIPVQSITNFPGEPSPNLSQI